MKTDMKTKESSLITIIAVVLQNRILSSNIIEFITVPLLSDVSDSMHFVKQTQQELATVRINVQTQFHPLLKAK